MSDETQLSDCLKTVAEAAAKEEAELDAARLALKEHESQVRIRIAALVSDVANVVFASNSQALRQKAVRGLYWGARVKAGIIAEAFGVNEHAIHSIAGPLVERTPCEGGCGVQVERTYRSHSDWRDKGRNSKRRIPHLCDQCKAKHDALGRVEYEKDQARQRAEAVAYCAQYGHHWGAEDIGGVRGENGVDWISNNRPIQLQSAHLLSIDTTSGREPAMTSAFIRPSRTWSYCRAHWLDSLITTRKFRHHCNIAPMNCMDGTQKEQMSQQSRPFIQPTGENRNRCPQVYHGVQAK